MQSHEIKVFALEWLIEIPQTFSHIKNHMRGLSSHNVVSTVKCFLFFHEEVDIKTDKISTYFHISHKLKELHVVTVIVGHCAMTES